MFYSGLSGLQLPIAKYNFPREYQQSSRLTYYSSLFNSIEINSSFYKIPQAKTVSNWAHSVPTDFRFTFKLNKEITHAKDFSFEKEQVNIMLNNISQVATKRGCLLIQLPPKLGKENLIFLSDLLKSISDNEYGKLWNVAVEFRNKSWYCKEAYELLNNYNSVMVFHDKAGLSSPLIEFNAGFVYVRFHGPAGNYRGTYEESFLTEYASYIKSWLNEGKIVYAYFNNTMGEAYNNLLLLNTLVNT